MSNLISKRGVRNLNILVPRNARVVCDVKKQRPGFPFQISDRGGMLPPYGGGLRGGDSVYKGGNDAKF